MPHWRVLELQNSVGQFMVHGARNQPSECTWIVVKVYLPDIVSEPQYTLLIFQRADQSVRTRDRDPPGRQAILGGDLPIRAVRAC